MRPPGVCVHGKVTLQSPSPFFGVFSFFLKPATSGFFRIFLAKPNNSAVRMLYGNRSNHVDLAVCFERSSSPPPPLAFPCKTQTKVSGLNLFFVLHFHPFSFGLFQMPRSSEKSLFVPGFFSLHWSYPLCVEASRAFSRLDFSNSAHLFSSRQSPSPSPDPMMNEQADDCVEHHVMFSLSLHASCVDGWMYALKIIN